GPVALTWWTSSIAAVQVKAKDVVTRMVIVRLRPHAGQIADRNASRLDKQFGSIANTVCGKQISPVLLIDPLPEPRPYRGGILFMNLMKQVQLQAQFHVYIWEPMIRWVGFVVSKALHGKNLEVLQLLL
ncbi:MAG: hypothetical protein EB069_06455, partial [Actinobacteria bacterium]|nr:hypothetical protein [Actinomycetota bacterium]